MAGGLWSDLDNIDDLYQADGRADPDRVEVLRRQILKRGPVVRLLAFDSNDQAPDDYEDDSTLILGKPAEEEPNEDSWSEELPFSDEESLRDGD